MQDWETKVKPSPDSSASSIKHVLDGANRPASAEPDGMPVEEVRPLQQIHKDLGRHLTDEPDGRPLPGEN